MSCAEDQTRAMDRIYRLQRHIYDLTRKYFLLGRDRLIDDLDLAPGNLVCEIGCGTGRNLIRAARRNPEARFFGIDASGEMLKSAEAAVRRAGLGERVTLARGLAETCDPKILFGLDRRFDVVFLSYSLSMIPDWRRAVEQAFRLVGKEGRVLVVDFGDQAELPRWFRGLLFAWLERFSVTPRLELSSVFTMAAAAAGGRAETRFLYRGYAQALSGHLGGGQRSN
ncbi:MAG: methyltransferase domain-containing protein [Hyphomicrobiales bacterium]|nr:methyltransferase domain-containing protein [Hyphomicrobiales bacterium]